MRKAGKLNTKRVKKPRLAEKNQTLQTDLTRRKFLTNARNAGFGLIAVGGGGAYFYNAYQNDLAERDLTKVGKGKPTIVQIHDPNCGLCTALQKQARSAISNFENNQVEFLVANILTTEGQTFANKYQAPHVTLLLFDGRGKLQQTLNGVRQEEELTPIFRELINKG